MKQSSKRKMHVDLMFVLATFVSASATAQQAKSALPSEENAPMQNQASDIAKNKTISTGFFAGRNPKNLDEIDDLREKGKVTNYPGTINTILGDGYGWRSKLAEYGIGVEFYTLTTLYKDFNNSEQADAPHVYNGQKGDIANGLEFVVTYDLDRIGIKNGQFITGLVEKSGSLAAAGEDEFGIRSIAYYQSLFDEKVEIKTGIMYNIYEFVGSFTGGSPLLLSPVGSLIPVQTGLSASPMPTPTFNLTLNGPNHTYFKGGIQESLSARGIPYQIKNDGFGGVGKPFSVDRTSALYIGEFGMNRAAAPREKRLWARAGAMYNTTEYDRFKGGRDENRAYYGLVDYQVTQPSPDGAAYKGIYLGATAEYAPPDVGLTTQSYALRAYAYGLFESRPRDAFTLRVNYNRYSDDANDVFGSLGQPHQSSQWLCLAGYTFNLSPGIFLNPAIQYANHPSFSSDNDNALVGIISLTTSW